jgi:hypothetical protein
VAESSEVKRQAAAQRQAFQEGHGYPANLVPDVWVGQHVAMNVLGMGGQQNQLTSVRASGMLEAVREDGYVISVEDRTVFMPKTAVLQMELHDRARPSTRVRIG